MDAQVDVPNENEDATTTETMCPETHGDRPLTPPSLPIHHAAVHAAADALNENEDVTETQPAVNEPHATIRANSENTSEEQATEQATEQAAGKHVDRNYDSEEDDADFNPDDPLSEEEVELSSSSSSSSEDESEGLAIQQAKEAALMTETLTNARDLRDLEDEPCAFCCRSCHAVVQVARKNKKQIIDEKAAVLPKTKVLPNCQTYPSISPFTFKFLKAVKTYPSTNTLVFCEKCDDFIWSYNMKNHYNAMHPHVRPSDYDDYKPSEAEMKSIDALFPLNIPK